MRSFNTEGPVRPEEHYTIDPLARVDVEELLELIQQQRYSVLRAPPRTGKTSTLLALRDLLNETGELQCVYANFQAGRAMGENLELAMRALLDELASRALAAGDGFLENAWPDVLAENGPATALGSVLMEWCLECPKPLVLLLDEVDSLVGDTLISVLSQLRSGYDQRPAAFPQSIILCGVHDTLLRGITTGGIPFNIVDKSLCLADFTEAQTMALMAQHTSETQQPFTEAAREIVWEHTNGQPWLVNAICAGACFDSKAGRDRSRSIDGDAIHTARYELILSRRTNLDQLAPVLQDERVLRVIEPMLAGDQPMYHAQDLEYVRDLGLVDNSQPPRMANPIYREVVPREFTEKLRDRMDALFQGLPEGRPTSDPAAHRERWRVR